MWRDSLRPLVLVVSVVARPRGDGLIGQSEVDRLGLISQEVRPPRQCMVSGVRSGVERFKPTPNPKVRPSSDGGAVLVTGAR